MKQSSINYLVGGIIAVVLCAPWVVNAYKLSNCDFEANYRCEVIHVIGLFGPLSWVTVWFDDDKGE